MVPVQHQPTGGTDMRANRQAFLHALATAAALLRGEASRDGYDWHIGDLPVVAHPTQEQPPTGISNTLCQMMILDQTSNVQVFKGNQVVSPDQRTRLLAGEVFTLPLHLELLFCHSFHGLLAIRAAFALFRDAPLQALQPFLSFPKIARVGNGVAVRVGIERLQANVNPYGVVGGLMLNLSVCLDRKLDIIAISPLDEPDPLDLLGGEGLDAARANQANRSDADA